MCRLVITMAWVNLSSPHDTASKTPPILLHGPSRELLRNFKTNQYDLAGTETYLDQIAQVTDP